MVKHREISSFKEFPLGLQVLILFHFVLIFIVFISIISIDSIYLMPAVLICGLLFWQGLGMITLNDVYRRIEKVFFNALATIALLFIPYNIIVQGAFVNYVWAILIILFSLMIVMFLSSDEILDIYCHPCKKHQTEGYFDVEKF